MFCVNVLALNLQGTIRLDRRNRISVTASTVVLYSLRSGHGGCRDDLIRDLFKGFDKIAIVPKFRPEAMQRPRPRTLFLLPLLSVLHSAVCHLPEDLKPRNTYTTNGESFVRRLREINGKLLLSRFQQIVSLLITVLITI